jgi:surface carbohydrate biosynthesis protein
MKAKKTILLIPVENQVREFDAKLLFACVGAKLGFLSIIGPRREVESSITSVPRSIYVSKDIRAGNGKLFRILRKLGHLSVAWDEEALIHQSAEVYYSTRISRQGMEYVSCLFAWGENNAKLWQGYSELNPKTTIHVTGNPRGDMLRPDMRTFFQDKVQEIQSTYGDFILINTNFTGVNAFTPVQNFFLPESKPREERRLGRAARGMNLEYAKGLRDHVQCIFEDLKLLIPNLEQAFPTYTIVVRPHPSENAQTYHSIAAKCQRVRVTNEGNVVPWLIAAKALIHNGCTTAIEAYAMGVPAIAYRVTVNEYYDSGLFRIPNFLSHECYDFEELREKLGKILRGELGVVNGDERRALFDHYLAAQDGPLASERIMDVLKEMIELRLELPEPSLRDRLEGLYRATKRNLRKEYKSHLPNANIPPEYQRHLYPGISLEELHVRIARFQRLLDYSGELKIERTGKQTYRIGS